MAEIIITHKRCKRCSQLKPATKAYFDKHSETVDGLHSWCRDCKSLSKGRVPVTILEKTPDFISCPHCKVLYPANTEYFYADLKAKYDLSRACIGCTKKETARWAKDNKERANQYKSQYRKDNREKVNNSSRRSYKKHRATRLIYNANNKERIRINRQRRSARKRNLPDLFTTEVWNYALEYFNGCCAVCGRQLNDLFGEHTAAADHWIPLSSHECPGTVPENMVPLCHGAGGCNNIKSNRNPVEFLQSEFGKRKAKHILKRIQTYFDSLNQ